MTDVVWKVMALSKKICIPCLIWLPCINATSSCQSSNFANSIRKSIHVTISFCCNVWTIFATKLLRKRIYLLYVEKIFLLECWVLFCRIWIWVSTRTWRVFSRQLCQFRAFVFGEQTNKPHRENGQKRKNMNSIVQEDEFDGFTFLPRKVKLKNAPKWQYAAL